MRTRSRIYLIALALFSLFLSGCDLFKSPREKWDDCLFEADMAGTETGRISARLQCHREYQRSI